MMRFIPMLKRFRCPMLNLLGLQVLKAGMQIAGAYEDEDIRKKIQSAFPVLGIVAFSGHVIDQPGSSIPRFPQSGGNCQGGN